MWYKLYQIIGKFRVQKKHDEDYLLIYSSHQDNNRLKASKSLSLSYYFLLINRWIFQNASN